MPGIEHTLFCGSYDIIRWRYDVSDLRHFRWVIQNAAKRKDLSHASLSEEMGSASNSQLSQNSTLAPFSTHFNDTVRLQIERARCFHLLRCRPFHGRSRPGLQSM